MGDHRVPSSTSRHKTIINKGSSHALHRRRLEGRSGFTLIEMLIVIIVLGILAAIVVVGVGSTRRDAAASACGSSLKSVELSTEAYNTRMNHYPDTQADVYSVDWLLRSWPTSDQYALVYDPTGYSAGPPIVHASGFFVTVKDGGGATVASCSDL